MLISTIYRIYSTIYRFVNNNIQLGEGEMAKTSNMEGLDLNTLKGRLAYAVKTKGPKYISEITGISTSMLGSISAQKTKTSLDNAALIAHATGFELKWIALGEGPQMSDADLWEYTSSFNEVMPLDENQKLELSFNPDFLEQELKTKPANCRVWKIDYKINLDQLEQDFIVLIDTSNKQGSGRFVVNVNDVISVVDIRINIDGSATIKTDSINSDTDQTITDEQYKKLNIQGRVIWHGGRS